MSVPANSSLAVYCVKCGAFKVAEKMRRVNKTKRLPDGTRTGECLACAAATRREERKHWTEAQRERNRRAKRSDYHRRRTDPAYMAHKRALNRAAYAKRISTEAGRAALRATREVWRAKNKDRLRGASLKWYRKLKETAPERLKVYNVQRGIRRRLAKLAAAMKGKFCARSAGR